MTNDSPPFIADQGLRLLMADDPRPYLVPEAFRGLRHWSAGAERGYFPPSFDAYLSGPRGKDDPWQPVDGVDWVGQTPVPLELGPGTGTIHAPNIQMKLAGQP